MNVSDRFIQSLRRVSPSIESARDRLWTTTVDGSTYTDGGERYQAAILEQYRLYVEMADRMAARRGLTNTFLLTVNTATLTAAGAVLPQVWTEGPWLLVIPCLVLVAQCAAWFWIIRSYRQLSSAKFRVIGALEERLPASPYWRAEWGALGSGQDRALYWPVTTLEQWIPALFAVLYLAVFVVVVVHAAG